AGTTTATVVESRDTAYQDLASEQLLLTRSGNSTDDGDEEDSGRLSAEEVEEDGAEDALFVDLMLDDGTSESLEVLRRERAAIDAALAELQNFDAANGEPGHDAETETSMQVAEPTARESDAATATMTNEILPPEDASQGGMVWLVPTGDANSSAFDLSELLLRGQPALARGTEGMEASIGMYQAFDVGGAQAIERDASISAAKAPRPNVSADSDTAGRLERSS
ncbi:MAG TPA: hypothetical protein PJ982_18890, partial [Lacipirellulaceae bacterium]|nr:hypothetical protein [Lacipirellulaceae bacterium]